MVESLYIHIPFCEHICSYCDFCKMFYNEKIADKYVDELLKEIESYNISSKLKTIYLGGGTPSSLNILQLEKILKHLEKFINYDTEFTVECNFENTTKEKLQLFYRYHVNRLSFGIQTFDQQVLTKLNRHHSSDDIKKTISLAKEIGFKNINVDLIYGLPEITNDGLSKDLEEFIKLDVQHISTYSLMIEPNTKLYLNGVKEESDEQSRLHYDFILEYLKTNGFERYEVSNYSKKGYESKHNQVYWDNKEYYGVGLGAAGYLNKKRYKNTRSINEYLKGNYLLETENVSYIDNINYFLMLKLRKVEGFTLEELKEITNEVDFEKIKENLNKFVSKGLLENKENQYYCSNEGIMLLDIILRDIFLEED